MQLKNKVLIIDDSKTSQMITKSCLEICGIIPDEFLFASNGEEGLAFLEREVIDFIVVDLNMPVMSGEEFLRKVKSNMKTVFIPVVVLSSIVNQAKETELLDIGAIHVLKKPLSPAKLKSIVNSMIGE